MLTATLLFQIDSHMQRLPPSDPSPPHLLLLMFWTFCILCDLRSQLGPSSNHFLNFSSNLCFLYLRFLLLWIAFPKSYIIFFFFKQPFLFCFAWCVKTGIFEKQGLVTCRKCATIWSVSWDQRSKMKRRSLLWSTELELPAQYQWSEERSVKADRVYIL